MPAILAGPVAELRGYVLRIDQSVRHSSLASGQASLLYGKTLKVVLCRGEYDVTRCQQGLIPVCIFDISEVPPGHVEACADFIQVPVDFFKGFRPVAKLLAHNVEAVS